MTDGQLVKNVLEWLGWTEIELETYPEGAPVLIGYPPNDTTKKKRTCPDFLHDRNAVAEVVGRLDERRQVKWGAQLVGHIFRAEDSNWVELGAWSLSKVLLSSPKQQLQALWEVVRNESR